MTHFIDVDTIASDARVGDYFRMINGADEKGVKIGSVKIGSKWTVAREEDGQLIFRRLNGEQTWLMREVPTQEELDAKAEADALLIAKYREEQLHTMMNQMIGAAGEARRKLIDHLASIDQSQSGLRIDYAANLLKAEILTGFGVRLQEGLHRTEHTITELFEMLEAEIKEGLVEGYNEPHHSGGFSFSNAERQLAIDTRRELLRSMKWMTL